MNTPTRGSVAVPTAYSTYPNMAATGSMSRRSRRIYQTAQQIKDRYEDGQPLAEPQKAFMLGLLRQHPRGRQKFGCGVRAVVVGRFIGGSRCFFVIRADGSVEDFSVPRCLGVQLHRTAKVAAMMAAFRYEAILRLYQLRTRTALRTGGSAVRL